MMLNFTTLKITAYFFFIKGRFFESTREVYSKSYRNKIYFSERDSLGEFKAFEINKDLLNEDNYGNGSFSTDGSKFITAHVTTMALAIPVKLL